MMKILAIGFLILFGWSAGSTYIYVCKIKGFCSDSETIMVNEISAENQRVADSLSNNQADKPVTKPGSLTIHFEFDKSEFTPDTKTENWINEFGVYFENNSETNLLIRGHTDAIGTEDYNLALGNRRAQSVMRYFEAKGLQANKIILESAGETEPVDNNSTSEGRANNRRTEIRIK
jgi:outer membrane protein OmpA-like peptidoglycan-associated protein